MNLSYSRRNVNGARGGNAGATLVGVFFFIIGIALVVGGVFVKKSNDKFMENAKSTQAIITNITSKVDSDGDVSHSVFVSYTIDGKFYENVALGYYTSSMNEGQTLDVYYNEDNPRKIKSKQGSAFATYLMWGMGAIFALVGGIVAVTSIKVSSKSKNQVTVGDGSSTLVWCEIANVYPTTLPSGTIGYIAECAMMNGSSQNIVKSQPVTVDIRNTIGSMAQIAANSVTGEYNLLLDSIQATTNYTY